MHAFCTLMQAVRAELWLREPGPEDSLTLWPRLQWPVPGEEAEQRVAHPESILADWGLDEPGRHGACHAALGPDTWRGAWALPSGSWLLVEAKNPFGAKAVECLWGLLQRMDSTLQLSRQMLRFRRVEEELLLRDRKQRQIIDTSLDAVMLVDGDARIQRWNLRAKQLFGYTAEEAIGERWYKVVLPEETWPMQDEYLERFQQYGEFPESQYIALDVEVCTKTGERFPAEMSFSHLPVDDGHHFVLYFRDITRRKQVESDLIRARQEAEAAERAEQAFLAHMSHELRTPLHVVIGIAKLLKNAEMSESTLQLLNALDFSANHLLAITQDILDLSKIKAGKIDIRQVPFRPGEWLDLIGESFRSMLGQRPVHFHLEVDQSLPEVIVADRDRFNQIVFNLLQNAMKFTEEGFVRLRAFREQQGDVSFLRLEIMDSGPGMSSENLQKVFQEYAQMGQISQGAGLGLSIVRQLVKQLGGELDVQSEPGKGTSFSIHLPFQPARWASDPGSEKERPLEPQLPNNSLAGKDILVVEDDPMNRRLLERIISDMGGSCHLAANATIGFDLACHKAFDLILLDLNLPEADGRSLARAIQEEDSSVNREVPIIALTANARLEEMATLRTVGIRHVLVKPYPLEDLRRLLMEHLTR